MPKFSLQSEERLKTCHNNLYRLFEEVVKNYDCTIIEGYRSPEKQDEAFKNKKSKLKSGKHNLTPSYAVDVSPYPIPANWGAKDYRELARFYHFAGYVKAKAEFLGIKIRWGGDWDSDNVFSDQTFNDLVHFELV